MLSTLVQRANLLLSLREIGLELDAESMAHGGPVAAVLPKENDEDKPVLGPQVLRASFCVLNLSKQP